MEAISPDDARNFLASGKEVAILDLREEGIFSTGHLLFATNVPLSRLELLIGNLVPRLSTPIILCGEGDDAALIFDGGERLKAFGYRNITYLDGGVDAWKKRGFQAFSGVNVPSKAFGEFVEEECKTPHISADELDRQRALGEDIVVLDSRPLEEYQLMSIPGAINVPGAELAYRIYDLVSNSKTKIVVNCAGRTRSIIGTQSLINARIPNPVMALENGTMGWHLAGKKLVSGKKDRYSKVSESGHKQAIIKSNWLFKKFDIKKITTRLLAEFLSETERTTFILDVRDPTEFEMGHIPGSISAPGGQLVQATDQYVGVMGARLVFVDNHDIRAVLTASWLKQMGWSDVFVLKGGIKSAGKLKIGQFKPKILGYNDEVPRFIGAQEVNKLRKNALTAIIDLTNSLAYRDRGHIPGAIFAIRSRLKASIPRLGKNRHFILTSLDGTLATIASNDKVFINLNVQVLRGGTNAWIKEGLPLEKGLSSMLDGPDDRWYRPYDQENGVDDEAMKKYLKWEVNLTSQIKRDGTAKFFTFSNLDLPEISK